MTQEKRCLGFWEIHCEALSDGRLCVSARDCFKALPREAVKEEITRQIEELKLSADVVFPGKSNEFWKGFDMALENGVMALKVVKANLGLAEAKKK